MNQTRLIALITPRFAKAYETSSTGQISVVVTEPFRGASYQYRYMVTGWKVEVVQNLRGLEIHSELKGPMKAIALVGSHIAISHQDQDIDGFFLEEAALRDAPRPAIRTVRDPWFHFTYY